MNSAVPTPKIVAAALGGAVATILLWLFGLFRPEIVVPQEVAAALTTILATAFGYLKSS